MIDQKVTGILVNPIGITQYLYSLNQVLNIVFYSYPSIILTRKNPSRILNFINYLAPQSLSISSLISSNGYQFFYITLFSRLKSIYNRNFSFFFSTNSTRDAIGLSLYRIYSRTRLVLIYSRNTSFYSLVSRYIYSSIS